jgi:hypothetical protein
MRNENQGGWRDYLSCEMCKSVNGPEVREDMNCGWLPNAAELAATNPLAQYPIPGDAPRPESGICPGYLIRLPQVREAEANYAFFDKGCLPTRYPNGVTEKLLGAMLVLQAAQGEAYTPKKLD